jgi:hypothetical protein
MHITPAIVGCTIAILVIVNVVAVCLAQARQRRVRAALGVPERMRRSDDKLRMERAIDVFEDTEAKLRKRAPHLSRQERHEMARALVRAKGLLPPESRLQG